MKARIPALTLILIFMVAGAVTAGVPCAGTSDADCFGDGASGCNPSTNACVCPSGDVDVIQVSVTIRDCYANVLPGRTVDCYPTYNLDDFCFCPGVEYQQGTTDTFGQVCFFYDCFGGCAYIGFTVECEGIQLISNQMWVGSPDLDATCFVGIEDFAMFASAYGGPDDCCDYDCSGGNINLTDFAIFAAHYGHGCPE